MYQKYFFFCMYSTSLFQASPLFRSPFPCAALHYPNAWNRLVQHNFNTHSATLMVGNPVKMVFLTV